MIGVKSSATQKDIKLPRTPTRFAHSLESRRQSDQSGILYLFDAFGIFGTKITTTARFDKSLSNAATGFTKLKKFKIVTRNQIGSPFTFVYHLTDENSVTGFVKLLSNIAIETKSSFIQPKN